MSQTTQRSSSGADHPETGELNRRLVLAQRPHGLVDNDTVVMRPAVIPEPGPGEALARVRFLSIDPAIRTWMDDDATDMTPIAVGDVVRCAGIAEIVVSHSPRYRPGDLVFGLTGWQDYVIADEAAQAMRVLPDGIAPTLALCPLGINGLTAYFGMLDVGGVREGDVVLISGAAGATGSIAAQTARIKGAAKVIGIAGGPRKCSWLVEQLDEAIDYHSVDVGQALSAVAPKGVDLFYDNVGGPILDTGLSHLAHHARVVLCGAIAGYNTPTAGPANYQMLIYRAARMQGFVIQDYFDRFGVAQTDIATWLAAGQITSAEHLIDGLQNAPEALNLLFAGANTGKTIVRI